MQLASTALQQMLHRLEEKSALCDWQVRQKERARLASTALPPGGTKAKQQKPSPSAAQQQQAKAKRQSSGGGGGDSLLAAAARRLAVQTARPANTGQTMAQVQPPVLLPPSVAAEVGCTWTMRLRRLAASVSRFCQCVLSHRTPARNAPRLAAAFAPGRCTGGVPGPLSRYRVRDDHSKELNVLGQVQMTAVMEHRRHKAWVAHHVARLANEVI